MRTGLTVGLSLVVATLLVGCGSSDGATGAPTRIAPASPGTSSPYPLASREPYPIPQATLPMTMTGTQTVPPSPSSVSTAAASLVPSVPSTPTTVPSRASPTNSGLDTLNDQTMALLTASPDYQAIIQRGDRALQIVPAHATDQASPLVVFYLAVQKNKAGEPIPAFSPVGIQVLELEGTHYRTTWQTITNAENWLSAASNHPGSDPNSWRHTVMDLTGDTQGEIVLGGCVGYGQHCYYQLVVWSLGGHVLFQSPEAQQVFVQLVPEHHQIRTAIGIGEAGVAPMVHPEQWQKDTYQWNGTTFIVTDTRNIPYTEGMSPFDS